MKVKLFRAGLLFLTLLATVKICILGLGIDEEYAVTMAYRITRSDRMFLEMWEPHQTSGFLCALLVKGFMAVTGGTEYLILFLRLAGALIQALISVFLYSTLKRNFSEKAAFYISLFFYNTLPKWIQTPEFSNMLVWFGTLAFACLLRYYLEEKGKRIWLAAAGLCISLTVLSYPSTVCAFPVILFAIRMVRKEEKALFWKEAGILLGTCGVLAAGYLIFFLSNMTAARLVQGIGEMMSDGSHDITFARRLLSVKEEAVTFALYTVLAVIPAALILLCFARYRSKRNFVSLVLIFSLLEQIICWLGKGEYMQRPLVYFYLLLAGGIWMYAGSGEKRTKKDRILFWLGSVTGTALWLSAFAVTNTTVGVTGSYLMPALIAAILFLWEEEEVCVKNPLPAVFVICLLGVTLFAKGFLVCSTEGRKDDVTMVRQKILSGPAKGIYGRYIDGYAMNLAAPVFESFEEDTCVLYVGGHSLYYLLGDVQISNYSTISTPTFDERLAVYWDRFPDKVPEVIVTDSHEEVLEGIAPFLQIGELLQELENVEGIENIRVYRVNGRKE